MDTNLAFNILVYTLGSLLGIFLIISIIGVILIVRLIAALRQLVAKGEHLVDSAEELGETLKQHAGAVNIMKTAMQLMKFVNSSKRKG